MSLQSLWQRFNPFTRQLESVSLNPMEQVILRFLLRVKEAPRDSIQTELNSMGTADPTAVDEVLEMLVDKEMVSVSPGNEGQLFQPTAKARKLRNNLPVEPRTVMEFYL